METETLQFKRFEEVGKKRGTYYISVGRHGALGLCAGFYNAEKVKDFSHAVLFFNQEKKYIGVSFTNDKSTPGAFKITHGQSSSSVVARSFFMTIFNASKEELHKYSGQYTPKKYADPTYGVLFYIDLNEKGQKIEIAKGA